MILPRDGEPGEGYLRIKIRLDYRGEPKPAKFFFGAKEPEQVAEEIREQKVALWRNVPIQGIQIEDIDISGEIYIVYDESFGSEVAFAPVQLVVTAEKIEDILRFVMREEFRKIEIIEPENLVLNRNEIERLLFKMHEELRFYRNVLEKRLSK